MTRSSRKGYGSVAVTVPVTVPYVRYSTHGAHWFIGRVLAELVRESGIDKDDIDGLCVSSFTLAPDTAVGLTQHLGLSPDHGRSSSPRSRHLLQKKMPDLSSTVRRPRLRLPQPW